MLFNMKLTHGAAPEDVLLSTLVSIPKHKRRNKCNSNNYRQIAISSFVGNNIRHYYLDNTQISFETEVLQFGFKKIASTVFCTSMLKETIDYYNENKLIAIYYCWMTRRHLQLNVINCSIACLTGICVQLY